MLNGFKEYLQSWCPIFADQASKYDNGTCPRDVVNDDDEQE